MYQKLWIWKQFFFSNIPSLHGKCLRNRVTIFSLLNSPNKIMCCIISYFFCLFRTTSVEKPVPVLSFETHPYQIPYTQHHFEKKSFYVPYPYFVFQKRPVSVPYPYSNFKIDPFTLRSRFRTWVRVRNVYGFRTRIPDSVSKVYQSAIQLVN